MVVSLLIQDLLNESHGDISNFNQICWVVSTVMFLIITDLLDGRHGDVSNYHRSAEWEAWC